VTSVQRGGVEEYLELVGGRAGSDAPKKASSDVVSGGRCAGVTHKDR